MQIDSDNTNIGDFWDRR